MIQQLVAALYEAGVEIDAEAIAEALWLARVRRGESGDVERQRASVVRRIPTEPRPPDAEPQDPISDTQTERADERGSYRSAADQAGSDSGVEVSSITLRKARALPGTLELSRALRPLKQRHSSKRRRVLNADATIEYFCDTGVLTPVMLPGAERWFDIDVLVDVGPSMAVWQDTAAEFVSLLQRHGAFRAVRQWNLEQTDGKVRLSRAANVRTEAAQLVDPHARRLMMLVTDCIGPMWYQAPVWEAIRRWGLFSPVVVISPLPPRLWPGTALGSPEVSMRSHRRGAANRSLDVRVPWWWPDNEPPLSAVPVPVITLDAGQVATWARMVMGAGEVESLGVFATPPASLPGKAVAGSGNGPPDAEERVRRFRVTVSPVGYRLAVYLSAVLRDQWGLGLARVVQEAALPDSRQVHLAEVLVGGLVRQAQRPEEQEESAFEFIDGVVNVLQRSLTGTEALRVLQALSAYIERETGRSPGIAALLLGETAPADATEEFGDIRAGAADLIRAMGLAQAHVVPGQATEATTGPPVDTALFQSEDMASQVAEIPTPSLFMLATSALEKLEDVLDTLQRAMRAIRQVEFRGAVPLGIDSWDIGDQIAVHERLATALADPATQLESYSARVVSLLTDAENDIGQLTFAEHAAELRPIINVVSEAEDLSKRLLSMVTRARDDLRARADRLAHYSIPYGTMHRAHTLIEDASSIATSLREGFDRLQTGQESDKARGPITPSPRPHLASSEHDWSAYVEVRAIPVPGRVAAGPSIIPGEGELEYLLLPAQYSRGGNVFPVRMTGDSMTGDRVFDGDYVVVDPGLEVGDREMAVVRFGGLDDSEAIVRRLWHEGAVIRLESSNPGYSPIILRPDDQPVIVGRVIAVTRPLVPQYSLGRNVFAVKVRGDSMTGDGVFDGDYVVVDPGLEVGDREMVVVRTGGPDGEAIVRRLWHEGAEIRLESSNPDYSPVILGPDDEPVIVGRVIAVTRPLVT